ncbi:biotin/lipoyl-containing protein [Vibrio parahaemolyticus]|uniref:biotin/lipoyl-containing protein n=1 Tax=Vibrio parahaemolyticus TaxID=670 RepID=UPI0038D46DF7
MTVEGDKASMEVPASQAGIVKEIKVAEGDKVSTGSLIMIFEAEGAAEAAPAPAAEAAQQQLQLQQQRRTERSSRTRYRW